MAIVQAQIRWSANVAELKANISEGIGVVDAMKSSVDRVVSSLSGNGLFQAANKVTAAIIELGDTTKLTASEQERANALLDKAIEKYQAMGMVVPPAMQSVADSLKPPVDLLDQLGNAFEHPIDAAKALGASVQEHVISVLGPELGPAVEIAVGALAALGTALFEAGEKATETGASLEKLSMVSGAPVEGLSDLRFALDATGNAGLDLDRTMFMFQQRMETSAPKVAAGLALIGLSVKDLQGLSEDQQMLKLSDAFRASEGSVNLAAAAFQIFGKQGREILPSLLQPLADLTEKSQALGNTWSAVDAKAAHEFELAQAELGATTASTWSQIGREVMPVTSELVMAYLHLKEQIAEDVQWIITFGGTLTELEGWLGRNALAAETAAAKQDVINKAISEGADPTIKFGDAVKYVNEQYEKNKPAEQQAEDAAAAWLKSLSDDMKKTIDANAAHAYLIEGLARMGIAFGTTKEEIDDANKAHDKGVAAAAAHAKALDAIRDSLEGDSQKEKDNIDVLDRMSKQEITNIDTINRMADALAKLHAKHIQLPPDLEAWRQANLHTLPSVSSTTLAIGTLSDRLPGLNQHLDETITAFDDVAENGAPLISFSNQFAGGISIAGDQVTTFVGNLATLPKVAAQATQAIKDATAETQSFGDVLGGQLTTQLEKLPGVFAAAFDTNGGIGKALQQEAKQLGQLFGKDLTANIQASIAEGGNGISTGTLVSAGGLGLTAGIGIAAEGDTTTTASKIGQLAAESATAAAAAAAAVATGVIATEASMITVAATVGAVTMGVGLAAVGVYLLYEHLKGASDEEKAARQAYSDWQDQVDKTFTSIGSAADIAAAGNDKIAQSTEMVKEAYLALGIDGSLAAKDVGIALDATHNSAANVKTVTDAMSAAITAYTKLLPLAQQGEKDLNTNLLTLKSITPQVAAGLQAVYNAKNIGDYVNATTSLNALIKQQATDATNVDSAMQKYGLSWTNLGADAKSAHIDTISQGLITDFTSLQAAGMSAADIIGNGMADASGKIAGMAPAIQSFVTDAMKAGVEVPDGMKPIIQSAIDQGLILDANGKKITDITQTGLTFGQTMTQGFQSVTDAINKLSTVLSGGLTGGFNAATNAANSLTDAAKNAAAATQDAANMHIPAPSDAQTGGGNPQDPSQQFAGGGIVQYKAAGGNILPFPFVPHGTDTVPAMLTPGERVLNLAQTRAYNQSGSGDLTALHRELQGLRADLADQAERAAATQILQTRTLPRQIRAAIQLAGAA